MASPPPIVVIMGVAGSGKSTVGEALAARLGVDFIEGDAYHSEASRAKMAAGTPLVDEDRWPWLDRLAAELQRRRDSGEGAVLACSALRRAYRDRLRSGVPELRLVLLHGETGTIGDRLADRQGHYMPAKLLSSQLETLELPDADERAVVVDIGADVPTILNKITEFL